MNIQLDMLSPLYYSTLGYDEELINYLAFIDDSFIYDLLPEYKTHTLGRKPTDPVFLFRMHFLYYIKNEEECTCKPRFSDTDATVGRQRTKVNQNKYFIGYRKTR